MIILFLLWVGVVFASPTETEIKTVLDPAPFISTRAASMGGGLSTIADGVHALYYNPAGIGGIHWGRKKPPVVRQLHFPLVGMGINNNALALRKAINTEPKIAERTVGEAILETQQGKRQYGRASGLFSMVVSRFTLVHFEDAQVAAFRGSSGNVHAAYRRLSGTGLGVSATDPKGIFYIGWFSAYLRQSEFAGAFTYDELLNKQDRTAAMDPNTNSYAGLSSNLGFIWVLGKDGRPAIAMTLRDVGSSKLRLKSQGESAVGLDTLRLEQNMTLGFSFSPKLGKRGAWSWNIEGQNLTNKSVALNKKVRLGTELALGGFGSEAIFALRAGYNLAGLSGGLSLNLGLVQFELASHAEDIGIGNRHVVERRNFAVFSVNVLSE